MLHIAVLGAGGISRDQHLPGWRQLPECRVLAICDTYPPAAEKAASEFGIERCETDYRRLLDDPRIDVVDICLPSALHAEAAIAALQAGKHVLCEKPMATARADAAAMLAASRASGRKLMIGQHMRFLPSAANLHQQLAYLDPGMFYFVRAQWLRRRRLPARPGFTEGRLSGGGALFDIGVHVADLAWWLMGCPRPLTASGGVFHHLSRRDDLGSEWGQWDAAKIDVEDFGAGLIRFEGGGLLSLEASWLGFQPEHDFSRVQLFGTRLGALWPECRLFGESNRKPWNAQLASPRGDVAQRELIRQFARAVIDDRPVPVPPEQSAAVIAMLEALYLSSARQCEQPVAETG